MAIVRGILLAASTNAWLRERAVRTKFVRRAVSRFMPGETADEAIAAAAELNKHNVGVVLTRLGENIKDGAEAEEVTTHYLGVLDTIRPQNLDGELSVKLTQLGLDLSPDLCYQNLQRIIEREDARRTVWIDMEYSQYVDATLGIYRRARAAYPNVGVCLQAYLYRTAKDLDSLLPMKPSIRLVKGAYKEPADVAFPRKKDVDENYFTLAKTLLAAQAQHPAMRVGIATHDLNLVARITKHAASQGIAQEKLEFQMLFGIQRADQLRLAGQGSRMMVLISYGSYWFPWYMRRLAERPANLWFVVRTMFAR
ncbi:MAG TPA: proline dehydrogenase family protein [Candidatus Acidoferrales bacterium]